MKNSKDAPSALGGVSVLYVEDDEAIREQLAQFLSRRVGALYLADNGREGLAQFAKAAPDIVVTDVLMPVMDGLQMAEQIKAQHPSTPIIVTTAFKETDYLLRAVNLAIDKYVLKPTNIKQLLEALEHCARQVLATRELKLAATVFSEARESIAVFDSNGYLLTRNPACDAFLKGTLCEQTNFSTAFGEGASELWQEALRSGSARGEVRLERGGEAIDALATINTIQESGSASRVIALLSDITEQKRAARQLQQLNSELEERVQERTAELRIALAAAEQASRAKSAFLANMSHELRTPLNGILGVAQSLRAGAYAPLTEEQSDAIALIEESGNHLLRLLGDVLDLSKIEANQMQLEMEQCSVRELCETSAALVSGIIERKRQQLEMDVPTCTIKADPLRLKQMLVNLLGNAAKFSPERTTIQLAVTQQEKELVFSVKDEGPGIAEADQSKLFQPFSQLGSRAQRVGTGLGLSLVKRMAELHGGRIAVKSKLGAGSQFLLVLPAPVSSAVPAQAATPVTSFPKVALGLDVLIAEDNRINVIVLQRLLLSLGCRSFVARDGSEAIELARAHLPDLVLMDVQMPGMDGLEATRAFRVDHRLANVPIIALTANAMQGDRDECLRAGADDYLSKPVSLSALSTLLYRFARLMRKVKEPCFQNATAV